MNGEKIRLKLLHIYAERFDITENFNFLKKFGVKASFFVHVGLIHHQHLSFDLRSIHVSLFVNFFLVLTTVAFLFVFNNYYLTMD
jgi:hypothetical protein